MSRWSSDFLTRNWADASPRARASWLSLALLVSAVYGALFLHQAAGEYTIQDDARQHVFWMQRFVEPGAFPNDLIADYFQSVAPYGYSALYWIAARLGLHPMSFSKIMPPLLALATAFYAFRLTLLLYPSAPAAFAASVLLNQSLWLRDNIVSGTPRAFATLTLVAFLYYLGRRALRGMLVHLGLSGMFYPQAALVSLGTAGLKLLRLHPLRFSSRRTDYFYFAACLAVALLALVPYFFKASDYGPAIGAAEARTMPEFEPQGRSAFFLENARKFWITGKRSGLTPRTGNNNPLVWLSLALPFLWRRRMHAASANAWGDIARLLLASAAMWAAAHVLLFKLHLPSRYTEQSLSIVLNLAGGIAAALLIERLLRTRALAVRATAISVLAAALLLYPAAKWAEGKFPHANLKTADVPELYEFFARQPKDIVIASLSPRADFIPSFSHRTVLVAREYAVPYHLGYYRQFSRRVRELIRAQYSPDLEEVREFVQRYGVAYVLLDTNGLGADYLKQHAWINQYQPEAAEALNALERGARPAIADLFGKCSVLRTDSVIVLSAECVLRR